MIASIKELRDRITITRNSSKISPKTQCIDQSVAWVDIGVGFLLSL